MSNKKILIFVVAYNAEKTINDVLNRIILDNNKYDIEILVIDDASDDKTFETAKKIAVNFKKYKLTILKNRVNQGYGGNQKLGYQYAINKKFDVVVLLHGDGQYAPEYIEKLIVPLLNEESKAIFGSRMIEKGSALKGGMPLYKLVGNKILSYVQNYLLKTNLSEFHSGYRAYTIKTLQKIPFEYNSNDFHFDTQIIIQLVGAGFKIKEIPIPTYYGDEICYVNGLAYAWNVLKSTLLYRFHKAGVFYQYVYDIEPDKPSYTPKLDFYSPHSKVVKLIEDNSVVFDIGCGPFSDIARELTIKKKCKVYGLENNIPKDIQFFKTFFSQNLDNDKLPLQIIEADFILLLDVLEHLKEPEKFLFNLRELCNSKARIFISVPNIAFIIIRIMLLFGIFNYGKEGILDKTHKRLFTFSSFKKILKQSGFIIKKIEGIPVPIEKALGKNLISSTLNVINRALIFLKKRLFAYQIFVEVSPLPVLQSILEDTIAISKTKNAEKNKGDI